MAENRRAIKDIIDAGGWVGWAGWAKQAWWVGMGEMALWSPSPALLWSLPTFCAAATGA